MRLHGLGVTAPALWLPVGDLARGKFIRLVNRTDQAAGLATASEVWDRLLAQAPPQEGDFIAVADAFDEPVPAEASHGCVDLIPLASGEGRPLTEGARRDMLRQRFSCHLDDPAEPPLPPGATVRDQYPGLPQARLPGLPLPQRPPTGAMPAPPLPGRLRNPHTRMGISTYSASGFAASVTTVGALPSAKRNSTMSPIWSVMSFR